MLATPDSDSPAAGLARELEAARELRNCLQQERECLIRADIAALEPLAGRKDALVQRMNALAAQRLQRLQAAGQPATEAGMSAWLSAQARADELRALWKELLAAAAAGAELNRVNGLLIHGHIGRNQAGLRALRGGGQPAMYGRDGQQSLKTSGRTFVAG